MKTSPEEILNELQLSAREGHVIGIKIKNQSRMVITAVEQVQNQTVLLKHSSSIGNPYQPRVLDLAQIESVIRFNSSFEDKLSVQIEQLKKGFE